MTKRAFLLTTVSLIGLVAAAASQAWVIVWMSPDGKNVELASADGYALHDWLALSLIFIALAALMATYLSKRIRIVLLIISAVGSAIASIAVAWSTLLGDSKSVQSTIDNAVNIASAHDIQAEALVFTWSVFAQSWILLGALAAWLCFATFESKDWMQTARTERFSQKTSGPATSNDPISLWESQR